MTAELVALLKEAREYVHGCTDHPDEVCACPSCEKAAAIIDRMDSAIDAALMEPGDRTLMLERQLDDALYRLAKTREALRSARNALMRTLNTARFTTRIIEPIMPRIDKVLDGAED